MATNTTNNTSSGNGTFIGTLFNAPPADVQAQAGIQWKVHRFGFLPVAFMVLFKLRNHVMELVSGQALHFASLVYTRLSNIRNTG